MDADMTIMVDQFAILPKELQHPLTEVGSRSQSIHDHFSSP